MNVELLNHEESGSLNSIKVSKNKDVISYSQHAVITLPSEGRKIIYLKEGGTISLGKFGSFKVDEVIGYKFGTSFEILNDLNVQKIKSLSEEEPLISSGKDIDELTEDEIAKIFTQNGENNQSIINIGSSVQKLSSSDIEELKKSGTSNAIGQQIIKKMIESHEGFDKKTIYSKLKYLKRKQQKFCRRFRIDYLSASQLLQYFAEKNPQKVLDLSEESLGLMLNYANVRKGGKYLLIDETGGIVLYSMLERMGDDGTIVSIHENEHPNHIESRYSDYPEDYWDRMVKTINWLQFLEPENEKIDWIDLPENEIEELKANKQTQYYKRKEKANQINNVIELVESGNFDALICVSTLYMPTLLPLILSKVGGSRPVVVYNQFKEPLVELQHSINGDKRLLAPTIWESKMRAYQTISGRLHPIMTSKGYGGYVLCGTRVFPKEGGVTAVGRGVSKSRNTKEVLEKP